MIEEVKKEMATLDAVAGRMTEEAYDTAKQVLLMRLYRATGPAKVKAACEHIENTLNQGGPGPAALHTCAAFLHYFCF